MNKIISISGIIGVVMILVFGLIDHYMIIIEKVYLVGIAVGFGLFVPLMIRELLSVRKNKNLLS